MAGRSWGTIVGLGFGSSSGRCETEFEGDIGFAVDGAYVEPGGLGCALEGIEVTVFGAPGTLFALLLLS